MEPRTRGFWSSEAIRERLGQTAHTAEAIVSEYDPHRVDTASYQLRIGREVYVSPTSDDISPQYATKRQLAAGEGVVIPSGQFAILTTEEVVQIPDDAIGLLALRSRAKFRGLVNISGFHVDPGYRGVIVFTVFNAGPAGIHVARGDPWFMISFAGLDRRSSDVRPRDNGYWGIPSDIISPIAGQFLTLKGLDSKIDKVREELVERQHSVEREHAIARWAAVLILSALIMLGVRQCDPRGTQHATATVGESHGGA